MTRRSEKSRRTWRVARRRRGAAMVEAVVAIPFFILIFVSILYVGKLYAQKQRTLREAKQQAWTYALNNCEGNAGKASSATEESPVSDLNGAGATLPPQANQQKGKAGGADLTKNWGTAVATVKTTVVADKLLGGFSNELSTTTRMQCNEKPAEGSIGDVVKSAWHEFTQW